MMHKELKTVYEDDTIKLTYIDMGSDDLAISVSSSPRYAQGEEISIEQFIGTLINNNLSSLFVIEKVRTQLGNNLNLPRVAAEIAQVSKNYNNVYGLGYCSGGSLAIVLSKYLYMKSVTAITPMWSFHPDFIQSPSGRFLLDTFTAYYENWDMKDIRGHFNDETQYYLFASDSDFDKEQMSYFPVQDNITKFEFGPAFGHDLPVALSDGKLEELIMSCIIGEPETVSSFILDYYKEHDQSIL